MFPDTGPLRLSRVSAVINLHHSKLPPYSQREEKGSEGEEQGASGRRKEVKEKVGGGVRLVRT